MIGIVLALGGAALLYMNLSKSGGSGSSSATETSDDPATLLERYDELRSDPQANAEAMKAIADRLNQLKWTRSVVIKASGNQYRLRLVNVFSDGWRMYDIFSLSGSRLLRYKQLGADTSTRKYVDSPADVEKAALGRAATDFGVKQP